VLTSPKRDERDVCLDLLARCPRRGALTVIGDKGYVSREFAAAAERLDTRHRPPRRKDETGPASHLAPIRQRIESILSTAEDLLTLERHGARTLNGLRVPIAQRLLALSACVALNHRLDRPPRSLAAYYA
jgi:hypothetical protein